MKIKIDACSGSSLISPESEYACAINKVKDLAPDEIILHLYVYELVERVRDLTLKGFDGEFVFPFWPESLFKGAQIEVHSVLEIMNLIPIADKIIYQKQSLQDMEKEATRVLGEVRFDINEYLSSVNDCAIKNGWEVLG